MAGRGLDALCQASIPVVAHQGNGGGLSIAEGFKLKSTCFNLRKADYGVTVLSDCITSYDKGKLPEMLRYYESKGSKVIGLNDLLN
jgi:hypothetical protein